MTHIQRHLAVAVCLASFLALAAAPALAQSATVYGTQAEYDAAVGSNDFCIDFNGSTGTLVAGSSFSAAVAFGSPEAMEMTQVVWSSDAITDAGSLAASNNVGPMDGAFTGTASAFRWVFSSAGASATVDLYAEDASLIATVAAPSGSGFFGVVSTVPVKRFVINPGTDAGTGLRDRFFVDDFCATATLPEPPPPEPEPVDLAGMCTALDAAVAAADPAAFRKKNRQKTLGHKLDVVCGHVADGAVEDLCAALQKLQHDILPKCDGEKGPTDWVTDPTVQQALEDQVNALIAALQSAIDALGGCPEDVDDDDGDGEGAGGNAGGNGHGRGRGHGNGGG